MESIEQISEEKDKLIREIDESLTISGANIVNVRKELQKLEKEADENMKQISLLL